MSATTADSDRQEPLFQGGPEFDPDQDPAQVAAEPAVEPEPEPDPEFTRMQRELDEARSQLQSERERVDRFLSQPPPPPSIPEARPVTTPMPDPATDPDAFAKWYAEDAQRRDAALHSEVTRTRNDLSEKQRAAQLRADFVSRKPHLREVLEYADVEFMRLHPDGVIPNDTDSLIESIAQALEEKTGRRAATPPTRTGGVSGPSETRTKKSKPSEPEVGPNDGTLVDLIKDAQAKSGLYG